MTKILKNNNKVFSTLSKIPKIQVFFHKILMKIFNKFVRKLKIVVGTKIKISMQK